LLTTAERFQKQNIERDVDFYCFKGNNDFQHQKCCYCPYICLMAEQLIFSSDDKQQRYEELLPQLKALIQGETNLIANLANVAAALNMAFGHLWTGFYVVDGEQLVLGPFQGPIACTRISYGRGVCGTAWKEAKTIVVPDVEAFPGHIACSSLSKSEIVVPVTRNGKVVAVLDVDSENLNTFDTVDQEYLEKICECVSSYF